MPPKRADPDAIDPEPNNYQSLHDGFVPESILSFRTATGRHFEARKDQKNSIRGYPYPNGEPESDCLDLQHAQLLLIFNGNLFLAPIPKDKLTNVLDFGTGTGIWAIDFAIEHPDTNVLAVDGERYWLKQNQNNLTLKVFEPDPEDEWSLDGEYDFIHNRVMLGGIEKAPQFINQAFKWLVPGGYLEMVSVAHPILLNDGKWPDDCKLKQWSQMVKGATEDLHPYPTRMYWRQMKAAGFKDIEVKTFRLPSGPWPSNEKFKKLGYWQRETLLRSLEAHRGLLAKTYQFTENSGTLNHLLQQVRREILDPVEFTKIHAYFEIVVVYGRRPLRDEDPDYDSSPEKRRKLRPKTLSKAKMLAESADESDETSMNGPREGDNDNGNDAFTLASGEDSDYDPSPKKLKKAKLMKPKTPSKPKMAAKAPKESEKKPTKGPRKDDGGGGNDPMMGLFAEGPIMR